MADESIPQQKKRYKLRALKPLPEHKLCSRCKEVFPASSFYTSKYITMTGRRSVILSAECRECHQKPMRKGRKAAKPLPPESTCKHCGETRPIGRFPVTTKIAKRGTVSYAVGGKCKDCINQSLRRSVRKIKALWKLPEEKTCTRCGTTKPRTEFKVRTYKTSTGRPSRKLHSMCHPCRQRNERRKRNPTGRTKGPTAHPVDQPKRCSGCKETKSPDLFGRRGKGSTLLSSRCKQCMRAERRPHTPEQAAGYVLRRREKEAANPDLLAQSKRYAAEHFQANKERIRLRNIETRRREPEKARLRAVVNAMRRRSFGCDRKMPEVRAAVAETLEAYRIGDQYWDVYDSCLIDKPTIDHLTAVTRGGTNGADNLTVTSLANNSSKGTLPLIVWLAKRAARSRKQSSQS